MTNQELEYLLGRMAREKIPLSRIDGSGAEPGDIIVWDGDTWITAPPPQTPGGTIRGLDLTLNFSPDSEDNVAVLVHGLDTTALSIQLITTAFDGLWSAFLAPWRILDNNRVEVRTNLGFYGPARAIISAIVPS